MGAIDTLTRGGGAQLDGRQTPLTQVPIKIYTAGLFFPQNRPAKSIWSKTGGEMGGRGNMGRARGETRKYKCRIPRRGKRKVYSIGWLRKTV